MSYTTTEERQRERIIKLEARVAELEGARAKACEGQGPCVEVALKWLNEDMRHHEGSFNAYVLVGEFLRRAEVIASQSAEIARLRSDLETSKSLAKEGGALVLDEAQRLKAENEELRALVDKVRAVTTEVHNQQGAVVAYRTDGVTVAAALSDLDRKLGAR